jgi:tight adherence protein C
MTDLYLILGVVCIAVAVGAALNATQAGRRSTVERLAVMIDHGLNYSNDADVSAYLEDEPKRGPLSGLATALGGLMSGRFTAVGEEAIREQLIAAGMYDTSPRTVLGYRYLLVVVLPILVGVATGLKSKTDFLMLAIAVFAGWAMPLTWVQRKARKRIDTIDRTLPDLIDLMCVMIEAGLSFQAAMRLASEQFGPPLSDELRLTLQEQTMGLTVDEALDHMSKRADTPALKAFVRAMSQGERMGISTGQIMRNLAHEMRHRRRSQAEERAQKTPVLILFPLVFMIFPAMFIILMTPAAINLAHNLNGF